jgi:hypothetical protein
VSNVSIFQILAQPHLLDYGPLARVAVSHPFAAVDAFAPWAFLAGLWLHRFASRPSIASDATQHAAITRPTAVTTAANVMANVIWSPPQSVF